MNPIQRLEGRGHYLDVVSGGSPSTNVRGYMS